MGIPLQDDDSPTGWQVLNQNIDSSIPSVTCAQYDYCVPSVSTRKCIEWIPTTHSGSLGLMEGRIDGNLKFRERENAQLGRSVIVSGVCWLGFLDVCYCYYILCIQKKKKDEEERKRERKETWKSLN